MEILHLQKWRNIQHKNIRTNAFEKKLFKHVTSEIFLEMNKLTFFQIKNTTFH